MSVYVYVPWCLSGDLVDVCALSSKTLYLGITKISKKFNNMNYLFNIKCFYGKKIPHFKILKQLFFVEIWKIILDPLKERTFYLKTTHLVLKYITIVGYRHEVRFERFTIKTTKSYKIGLKIQSKVIQILCLLNNTVNTGRNRHL